MTAKRLGQCYPGDDAARRASMRFCRENVSPSPVNTVEFDGTIDGGRIFVPLPGISPFLADVLGILRRLMT
jgi:hypothetical protein